MGYRKIDMIDKKTEQTYVIKRGKKRIFRQRVEARMVALLIAAYSEWEQLAHGTWSDANTGTRYMEGVFIDTTGGMANMTLTAKAGTLAAMLDGGYPSFDLRAKLRDVAYARGGVAYIPIGGGNYVSPLDNLAKLPPTERLFSIIQKNDDSPGLAIADLNSEIRGRGRESAAVSTKPLGDYEKEGDAKFITVSAKPPSKPQDMLKIRAYQGAMLADKVASFIEQNKDSFFADLFPANSIVDVR